MPQHVLRCPNLMGFQRELLQHPGLFPHIIGPKYNYTFSLLVDVHFNLLKWLSFVLSNFVCYKSTKYNLVSQST